jgi:threonine synthase
MEPERKLSARELEQMEVIGDKVVQIRDQVDERWPEVVAAAALAADCKKALMKEGFPEGMAIQLVGTLMQFLK